MVELPGQCYIDKIISLDAFQKLTVSRSSQKEFILRGKDLTFSINPFKYFFPLNSHNKITNKNSNLGEKLLLTVYKPSNARLGDYL